MTVVQILNQAAGGAGDLKADGSVPLTADWDVGAYDITAVEFKGALKGNADTVTNGVYTSDFPLNQDTTGKAATAGTADLVTNATLTTALTVDTGTVGLTGNAAKQFCTYLSGWCIVY